MADDSLPRVATDAVIFTVIGGTPHVLLVQMKKKPFAGRWAFPGGVIGARETTEAAARRILRTQTGVTDAYLEQLGTFDAVDRDPLGRVVTVAWFALVPAAGVALKTTDRYADVRWWPASRLPPLAYDHRAMARAALARVRAKLGYSNVAWSLLPKAFPLSDLQAAYEAFLGQALDKRNFLRKLLALGLVVPTGRRTAGCAHRPAALYRFAKRAPAFVDVL